MANKKSPNGVQGMVERLLDGSCSIEMRNKVNQYIRKTKVFDSVLESGMSVHNAKYAFRSSEQTDNLFCNVLQLDQLFHSPKVVEGITTGSLSRNELKAELGAVEKELSARFASYAYWMRRLEALKSLILSDSDFDFTEKRLSDVLQVSPLQDSCGRDLPFGIRAVQLMEHLEEAGQLTSPTAKILAEKADALLRLGELSLADSYAEKALMQDSSCSNAWVIRITVALKMRAEAAQEYQRYSYLNEGVSTPLTGEEHWSAERQDEALDEAAKQGAILEKILPGAVVHWPKVNAHAYQQEDMYRVARNLLIESLFRKIHPGKSQCCRDLAALYRVNGMSPEYNHTLASFHSRSNLVECVDKVESLFLDGPERGALEIVLKYRDKRLEDHCQFYGIWDDKSLVLDLQLLHLRFVLKDEGYAEHRQLLLERINRNFPDRVGESLLRSPIFGKLLILHQMQMDGVKQSGEFIRTWQANQLGEYQSRVSEKVMNHLFRLYQHQYVRSEYSSCLSICEQALQVNVPASVAFDRRSFDDGQLCLIHEEFWTYLQLRAAVDAVLIDQNTSLPIISALLSVANPSSYFNEESHYCKEIVDFEYGDEFFEPYYGESLLTSGEWERALVKVIGEVALSDQQKAISDRLATKLAAMRRVEENEKSEPWFEVHSDSQVDKPD